MNRLLKTDHKIENELRILEKSPDVPENALAVRRDLVRSLKLELKASLLNMHKDLQGINVLKDFGAQRFIETTDYDYNPVFNYATEISLDLMTYDYMNE